MKKRVNLIANSLTLLLISIKRNNVANPNLIKHSCRAHTTLRQVLAQLFHTEQRLVHWFTGFGLHNSAYCCQPWPARPLFYTETGTSVAVALRQRLSFSLAWQRVIVQLGPLIVMSFFSAWNQSVPLKADFWAVTQCHRWQRLGEAGG